MAGVRIYHPTERNVLFTLVAGDRPYRQPWECPTCHRVHEFKTYHIQIDSFGFSIVSVEIFEKLQRIPLQPFQLSNEVAKPPRQVIGVQVPILKVMETSDGKSG